MTRHPAIEPEWPCPYCGHTAWVRVWPSIKLDATELYSCGNCRVLWTASVVDGAWLGRMAEANWPGALTDFVKMRAETLRLRKPAATVPW